MEHFAIHSGFAKPLGNGLGHTLGCIPHGVIDNHGRRRRDLARPFLVLFHNLQRILPPDHAMAGRNHLHRQVQRQHLVNLLQYPVGIGRQDIREILERFLIQLLLVDQIVEEERRGVVLAERIVRHQDRLASHVGEHAVRPMEHRRLDKHQFVPAQADAVPGLHRHEIPFFVVMPRHAGGAVLGDDHLGIRAQFHQCGKTTGMVRLGVVHHHVVNLGRIHQFPDFGKEFFRVWRPRGIHEGNLLVLDQVRIVRGATVDG